MAVLAVLGTQCRVRRVERDRFRFLLTGREKARQARLRVPAKPGDELAPGVTAGASHRGANGRGGVHSSPALVR